MTTATQTKTYILFPVEGAPTRLTITPEDDELKVLQGAVGGLIQPVNLEDGYDLMVNEEGLLEKLPMNVVASMLANTWIVGDAVLVGPVDDDGEMTSVSAEWLAWLAKWEGQGKN